MPVVDEFYIIAQSGLCLYSKSRQAEIDQTLFSGFLTALNTMSQELTKEGISSLVFHNSRYTISKVEEILFIARTDTKTKDAVVRKELVEMQKTFLKFFSPSDIIKNWNGDTSLFKMLDHEYEHFFVASAAKRMASLF